jgi:hypothetical protein
MTSLVRLSVLGSAVALLLSGCAFGVTKVQVAHSPLASAPQKRQGTILVRQFVDERQEERDYIGTKRGGYLGIPWGRIAIKGDVTLQSLWSLNATTRHGNRLARVVTVRCRPAVTRASTS